MEKPIEQGDRIQLSLDYEVVQVGEGYIKILNLDDKSTLTLVEEKDGWIIRDRVPHFQNSMYNIQFSGENIFLTGDPHIDIQILTNLSDDELAYVCQTNKQAHNVCQSDEFWQNRIVTFYGPEFLAIFPGKNYVETYKLLTNPEQEEYQNQISELAINGDLSRLKKLYQLHPDYLPSVHGFSQSIRNGHVNVVDWLFNLPGPNININSYRLHLNALRQYSQNLTDISRYDIDEVVGGGHSDMVEWLFSKGIIPKARDLIGGFKNGQFDLIKWIDSHTDITFEPIHMQRAMAHDRVDMLDWLEKKGVEPNIDVINEAVANGNLESINWLIERGLYPNKAGLSGAVKNGKIDMVKWLLGEGFTPIEGSVDYAARDNRLDILKLLGEYNIYPGDVGIEWLIKYESRDSQQLFDILDTLIWLDSVIELPKIKYDVSSLKDKDGNYRYDVIDFLIDRDIYPNDYSFPTSPKGKNLELLKYLYDRGFRLTKKLATKTLDNHNFTMLDWLIERNVYPEQAGYDWAYVDNDPIRSDWYHKHGYSPKKSTANLATDYSHRKGKDIIYRLGELGIYPDWKNLDGMIYESEDLGLLQWAYDQGYDVNLNGMLSELYNYEYSRFVEWFEGHGIHPDREDEWE